MQKQENTAQTSLKQLRRKLAATGLCLASTAAMLFMVTGARYVTPAMRGNAELSPAYFNTVLLGDLNAADITAAGEVVTTEGIKDGNGQVIQTVSAKKLTKSLTLDPHQNAFGTSSKVYTKKDGETELQPRTDLNGAVPGDEFRMTFSIANGTTVHKENGDVDPANDTDSRNTVANQAETDIRYTLSIITTNNLPLTYSLKDVDSDTTYALTGTNMIYDALGGMCTVYTVKGSKGQIFDSEGARILPWLGEDTISFHRYQLIAKWDQNDDRYNAYAYDNSGKLIEEWVTVTGSIVNADGISTEDYVKEGENGKHYRYVRNAEGQYTFRDNANTEYKQTNEQIKQNIASNASYYDGWRILTYQLQEVPGNSAMYMKEIENIEVRVEVESFVNPTKPQVGSETYVATGQIVLGEDGQGILSMERFVNNSNLAGSGINVNILAARTVSYGAFGGALESLVDRPAKPTAEEALRYQATTASENLYRYRFRLANGVQDEVEWVPGTGAATPAEEQGEQPTDPAEPNILEDAEGHYRMQYTFYNETNGKYDPLQVALAVPLGKSGVGSDCLTGRKYYIVTGDGTRYDAVTNDNAENPEPDSLPKILVHYFKRFRGPENGPYDYSGYTNSDGWAVLNFKDTEGHFLTTKEFTEKTFGVQPFTLYMQCDDDAYTPHSRTSTEKATDSRDEFKLYFYKPAAEPAGG